MVVTIGGCRPGMQQVAGGVAAEVEAAGKGARVGVVCEGFSDERQRTAHMGPSLKPKL